MTNESPAAIWARMTGAERLHALSVMTPDQFAAFRAILGRNPMPNVRVTLNNTAGELDSTVIERVADPSGDVRITRAVIAMIESTPLAVGDTITIEEVR
jgi:hypothetical protein